MTESINVMLVLVLGLTASTTILSLLLIRKSRHAKRLSDEIRLVSAERNTLRQEVSELVYHTRPAQHKQPQATLYAAMSGVHSRHVAMRNTFMSRSRASTLDRRSKWQT